MQSKLKTLDTSSGSRNQPAPQASKQGPCLVPLRKHTSQAKTRKVPDETKTDEARSQDHTGPLETKQSRELAKRSDTNQRCHRGTKANCTQKQKCAKQQGRNTRDGGQKSTGWREKPSEYAASPKQILTSSPKDENVPFPVNRKKDSDLTGIKPQLFHGTLFSFPADSPLLCKCRKGRGSAMQNWSRAKVYVRPCSYFSHGRMNRVCKVRNLICQFNVHSGRSKSKVQNQSCG